MVNVTVGLVHTVGTQHREAQRDAALLLSGAHAGACLFTLGLSPDSRSSLLASAVCYHSAACADTHASV